MAVLDTFGRPLRSLRISVTDRCNIRCAYCMPEAEYVWLPRQDLLTFEEIGRLVDVFVSLGVDRVRLTGGEPLLRRGLPDLVASIARRPGIGDLAMTSNGVLLAARARALKDSGLHRVTVSLDTLRRDRYIALARFDALDQTLEGVAAARDVFGGLKLDTVVIRGVNDDEIAALVAFAREWQAEVRFIEYMDVGGATQWTPAQVVSRAEILERLEASFGPPVPLAAEGAAPAERFQLPDGTTVGVIASTTAPFCRTCDRARLTADGTWLLCLYATNGIDLRGPMRAGASDGDLRRLIAATWTHRDDRGAEERLALRESRSALFPVSELRRHRHLEMHTRGG